MAKDLVTVAAQSAFARQTLGAGEQFAKRLQDLFNANEGRITVTKYATEERWGEINEQLSLRLEDGRTVSCIISTPVKSS